MDKLNNMEDMYKLSKDIITTDMFTGFSKIKENGVVSDFQIKVENKVFNVHRFILIAASPYFERLFRSNMKEVEQKFIEMKGLKADGIKYCLQFIYTRDIDLSKSPIESILPASHLLEINALTDLCFGYLRLNISEDNFISTLKLSQLYQNNVVMNSADQYILKHFKDIISTDDFLSLNQDDLTRYLENSKDDYASSWKAVVRWLDNKEENVEQLFLHFMETIEIENFPFEFIFKTVLVEPLVQRHQKARDEVMNILLSNPDQVKQTLSLETVFTLREFAKADMIPNAEGVIQLIHEFIVDNFASLAQKEEIRDLDETEIIDLFGTQNSYFAERIKFIAAVNWAGTDHRRRQKHFPKLFKLVKLEKLSSDFIQQNVQSESLVNESTECLNYILDCPTRGRTPVPHIACLYEDSDEVKIFNPSNNQWSHLVKVPKSYREDIVNNGNMLYVLADKDVLVLQDGTWLKKASMPRHPYRVVSFQDRIYGIDKDTMSCYDPMQNTWTYLPGCNLGPNFCVTSSDEFIYAMGGLGTNNEAKKFDPNTRTWSKITSMNIAKCFASAAVLNGKVFVMGGHYDKPLHDVEYFDPVQQRWHNVAGLCLPRWGFSSCVVNNKLYAVGGARNAKNELLDPNSIEVFNKELNKWEIVCDISEGCWGCCAIAL